jgi:hypothetical protein
MGKVWVLNTETKGTGANMVPLERVLSKPPPAVEPVLVPRKRPATAPEPSVPAAETHEFRVVDLMTRQELADGASVRDTVEALRGVGSVVDVMIYVWQPERRRWRMLTLEERRALWALAHP